MRISNVGVIPSQDTIREFSRSSSQIDYKEAESLSGKLGRGGKLADKEALEQILDADIEKERYGKMVTINQGIMATLDSKSSFITEFTALVERFKGELLNVRSEKTNPNFISNVTQIYSQLESAINRVPSLSGTSELYVKKSVDFSKFTLSVSATPDYSYCLGARSGASTDLDPMGTTVDVTRFTARDPMIEGIIRSIRYAMSGDPTDAADQAFINALNIVEVVEDQAMAMKESILSQKQFIQTRTKRMEEIGKETNQKHEQLSRVPLEELYATMAEKKAELDILMENTLNEQASLREYLRNNSQL